ncbi:MAG: alpha-galactosidase [Clostridia bacterium]|nr:alpha-galactosidase [Clostridia bacterium]
MDNILVKIEKRGAESVALVTNAGAAPVRPGEIAVLSVDHGYSPDAPIYGEGYQMLSQYRGTVGAPRNITYLSDKDHYRLPQRDGFNTVYNLFTVKTAEGNCDLYVFTSCRRFNGKIQWNEETLEMVLDLENVEIAPGETVETEYFTVMKDVDSSFAFSETGRLISAHHPKRALPERPAGWCSWYCFGPKVTKDDVDRNTDFISKNLPELKYIQIDDGYQEYMGDWLYVSPKFGDLGSVLAKINENGCESAIWVAPFIAQAESRVFREHPEYFVKDEKGAPLSSGEFTYEGWRYGPWYMLDGVNPGARGYLTHVFRTMREKMNIKYFKLDANVWGCFKNGVRYRDDATSVEAYREGMEAIFEGAGEDAVILGCNAPMWPSIGSVNAMRISGDLARDIKTIRMLSQEITLRGWMNGVFWVNDPDVFTVINQRGSDLTDNEIRIHKCLMFVSGGMMLSGDDMTEYTKENLRDAEILLGTPDAAPEVDRFDTSVVRIRDGGGEYVGIFNVTDDEKEFSVDARGAEFGESIWGLRSVRAENGVVKITLPARDADVIRFFASN